MLNVFYWSKIQTGFSGNSWSVLQCLGPQLIWWYKWLGQTLAWRALQPSGGCFTHVPGTWVGMTWRLGSRRGPTRTPTMADSCGLSFFQHGNWILRDNIPRPSVSRQKLHGLLWPSLGSHTVTCRSSLKPTQIQGQGTSSASPQWEKAQRMCSHLKNLPQ